jgi:hypothetical protein
VADTPELAAAAVVAGIARAQGIASRGSKEEARA